MFITFSIIFLSIKIISSFFIKNDYTSYKLSSYINTYFLSIYVSYNCISNFFNFSDEKYYNTMNLLFVYFIYDIIVMICFDFKKSLLFYIHHFLFILSYLYLNNLFEIYKYEINNFFLCEITQVFLIQSWLSLTFFNKKFFKINVGLLLFTFFIFRVLNFTYYTYLSFMTNLYTFPICFIILSMNLYWFHLLIKKSREI